MNRRSFLVSAAALGATVVAAGAAQAGGTSYVVHAPNYGALNLRSGPGTHYEVITQMPHGSRVTKLKWSGNWVKVQHESGYVGWCAANYLAPAHGDHGHQGGGYAVWAVVQTYDGCLYLRKGPGTGYHVVKTMYNGDKVEILGYSGGWRKVRHKKSGKVGWAQGAYLVS